MLSWKGFAKTNMAAVDSVLPRNIWKNSMNPLDVTIIFDERYKLSLSIYLINRNFPFHYMHTRRRALANHVNVTLAVVMHVLWTSTETSPIDSRMCSFIVWSQINRKPWPWWNSLPKIHLCCQPICMVVRSLLHTHSTIQCKTFARYFLLHQTLFGIKCSCFPFFVQNKIRNHVECCKDSPTPDDAMFRQLALVYAQNHPAMKTGRNCEEVFPNGITNGANWYELNGGMQDFNYITTNCFDVTLELSCCKFPNASTLPAEWAKNKRSLIEYMKMVHQGVKGIVTDHNGYPLDDMQVFVEGLESKPMRTTKRGEYWRLLLPGQYNVQITGFG